jgi:hypothetical protein
LVADLLELGRGAHGEIILELALTLSDHHDVLDRTAIASSGSSAIARFICLSLSSETL